MLARRTGRRKTRRRSRCSSECCCSRLLRLLKAIGLQTAVYLRQIVTSLVFFMSSCVIKFSELDVDLCKQQKLTASCWIMSSKKFSNPIFCLYFSLISNFKIFESICYVWPQKELKIVIDLERENEFYEPDKRSKFYALRGGKA